jgi:hypothetical protein
MIPRTYSGYPLSPEPSTPARLDPAIAIAIAMTPIVSMATDSGGRPAETAVSDYAARYRDRKDHDGQAPATEMISVGCDLHFKKRDYPWWDRPISVGIISGPQTPADLSRS